MEVAMLANKTDAAFLHVATETVTSVSKPKLLRNDTSECAIVLVSVATCKKPLASISCRHRSGNAKLSSYCSPHYLDGGALLEAQS